MVRSLETIEATTGGDSIFRFPQQVKRNCKTVLVLSSPKTRSSIRCIAIPSTVVKELTAYQEERDAQKAALYRAYEDYDLVIAQNSGFPMEERLIAKAFKSFIKDNDLPEAVFPQLAPSQYQLETRCQQRRH